MIRDIPYYEKDSFRTGDVEYLDEVCKLDIYPVENKRNFPVMVWFHGGGMTSGDREFPVNFDNGKAALVSVGYRLYGQGASCPDFILDAAAAIAWVIKHIGEYGGDVSRIYVSGHSAGAYLLTMVALNPEYLAAFGCHPNQIAEYFPLSAQMSTHFSILDERRTKDQNTPYFLIDEFAPLWYSLPDKNMRIHAIVGDSEVEYPARVEENLLFAARMRRIHGYANVKVDCVSGDHCQMLGPAMQIVNREIEEDGKSAVTLADIDKNFLASEIDGQKLEFHNIKDAPFEVEGFPWPGINGRLYRLPEDLPLDAVNDGVRTLALCNSGGAVRFRTDSRHIGVRAEYQLFWDMNHMPRAASCGFDLYAMDDNRQKTYLKTAQPAPENANAPFSCLMYSDCKNQMRDYVIYLPLYGGVSKLEIGLEPGARIEAPSPHKVAAPVVFYGSSITQGGCASRPANNYTTMLCRAVDAPQINLGYSGSAKGEPAMAEEIAKLKMSVFVYDYDYNAPDAEHLLATHEPFFKIIRQAQPNLPVIMMSRCSGIDSPRRDIVKATYEHAIADGDRNVWFIDGAELFGEAGQNACTVDTCHPNDLGFYMMYKRVLPVLQEALLNAVLD